MNHVAMLPRVIRTTMTTHFRPPSCISARGLQTFVRITAPVHRPQLKARPLLLGAQRRNASQSFRQRLFDDIRDRGLRRNWLSIVTFTILIGTTIAASTYYLYLYHELVDKPLSVYPPAAAQSIKTALYYASRGDVQKMASNFKAAIAAAEGSGMHPLSDEVAGLKIECAQLLLKMQDGKFADKAVKVMEHVLDEAVAGAEYFQKEKRWEDRSRVLKRAVLLGYKIGEMYQELGQDDHAEEAMVWSTETLLKEMKRREDGKLDEAKEGEWFDSVAVSACLEKMAEQYRNTDQHYLAVPLYLRAATLIPLDSCHAVTLMNNLASSISQQQIPLDSHTTTRQHLLEDAQKWAERALEIDSAVKPPQRSEECDEACVAATHNLGEIAALLGDRKRALERFTEALSLAKGLDMQEGIEAASEAIRRIEKAKKVDPV